jgi:tetratricopeptide (TPR) repeat protein
MLAAILLAGLALQGSLLERARVLFAQGDSDAARKTLEAAWDEAQKTPRADPLRYEVLRELAQVHESLGQFREAENYIQLAINWRETTQSPEDPGIPSDLMDVARLCLRMKDFERGLSVLERVRSIIFRAPHADPQLLADVQSRMAEMHLGLKEPDRAIYAYQRAVQLREQASGRLHPSLLADLERLGAIAISQRAYDKAETAFWRALRIRERVFGLDDPELLGVLDGLAYSLFGLKKYDEAEAAYKRILAIWNGSAGPVHPMIALTLDKMTVFYRAQDRELEAASSVNSAMAIRLHFLASGYARKATDDLAKGNRASARRGFRKALALLDPKEPLHQKLHEQLAGVLAQLEPSAPASRPAPAKRR